jgi:hypothetical protein
LLLHFAYPLRTELEGSEAEDLESHLAECAQCGAVAQVERRADNRIGQAMRAVPVPDGLRHRLLAQLDAERDAWYRRRVRRGLGVFAAAAALLLVVWVGFAFQKNRPQQVDLEGLAQKVQGDIANPTPDRVQDHFAVKGIATVAPPESMFNYRLLRYYAVESLQGKRVPVLLFTNGSDQARVYILSERHFDLEAALAEPTNVGSGCRIDVLPGPDNAKLRVIYVIIYTGQRLDAFKPQRPG